MPSRFRSKLFTLLSYALLLAVVMPAQNQTPPQQVEMYAWANPLSGPLKRADHTWVTDRKTFECPTPTPQYWYATGGCHPSPQTDHTSRPLSNAPGNLAVATCIAKPDTAGFGRDAAAQIVYGIDGVCHQISNRILAATATPVKKQITVKGANGYNISRFVYGTHGTPEQWHHVRDRCHATAAAVMTSGDELTEMTREAFGSAVAARSQLEVLRGEQARVQWELRQLRPFALEGPQNGAQFADRANQRINESLKRLAVTMGAEDFERFFEWKAGDPITLVEPSIAGEINYASAMRE